MKALAAFLGCAVLAASIWLGWLTRRPVEFNWYGSGTDQLRISGLAIAVGILTIAVTWIAARPGARWTLPVSISAAGVLTVLAAARRPQLPTAAVVLTDIAWLSGAAAVAAMILASPRFANVPRRPAAALLAAVAGSGVAAAVLDGGSGLGATIGSSPSTDIPSSARVMLAVHLVVLITAVAWLATRWWRTHDSGIGVGNVVRDPVVLCGALWFVVVVVERSVHLLPLDAYRDLYRGTYLAWPLVTAVHLPLIAAGAVIGSIGWSIGVRPRVERLPSGMFVLPATDPVTMLRNDVADWVGDPTLQLAFADGTGRWIGPSGEVHLENVRYDRATTIVTRDGRAIGVLDHDIALSNAPDALHTAAALAGLAFDANRLLAVSEGRLVEARRLGERLLGADVAMRAEMETLLAEGPIKRLRTCADDLYFGAPIDTVVEPIRQATAEVRQLSHGLYPPELIEGGLGAVVGDRRGAPRRRLPAAIEVTAFRLVTDDPMGWFEDHGTVLRVHVRRQTIRRSILDRIDVLGGTVSSESVDLPLDLTIDEHDGVSPAPTMA